MVMLRVSPMPRTATGWRIRCQGGGSVLLILGLLGCSGGDSEDVAESRSGRAAAAVCLGGAGWAVDGPILVRGPGRFDPEREPDAHWVSGVRHAAHPGCERVVIDLVTRGGMPAGSVGEVRAQVLRRLGVVRISLPAVPDVQLEATDRVLEGTLADRAFVLRSAEGHWIDVDVHLLQESEVHVSVLHDPVRVVVDLRPGGGPIPPPPVMGRRIVVLEPRPGEASHPLQVSGYARTFEGTVAIRLEREGEVLADTFTMATAWIDAWGHFEVVLEDGTLGLLELHVGEHSARDGSWEGVLVELDLR
jgi:hypothetical protein